MMLTESVWLSTLSAAERSELTATDGELLATPDVLVVGGGIVGLATAYFLTELGARVQVIEAGSLAGGATGASAGGIWPNEQGPSHPPAYQPLAFLGRDLWGRLAVRPEFDFDWRVNGFLNLNAERFAPSADAFAAQTQDAGFSLKPVDADQIARLEPQLTRGFREGLHYPSEAHLHPIKASLSLARAARRAGCRIRTETRAIGVETSANRIIAVNTTAGRIEPRHVVATTGWTMDWLGTSSPLPSGGEGLGVRGPSAKLLRPVSGQMIATDPQPPLLKCSIGGRVLVIQLKSGEIVVGASVREDSSLEPDPAVTAEFIAATCEIVPALRDIPFRRVWCGVRPATPDSLPILDRSPTADNLWLNCGHFRNGLLLAPACGKLLAEWLVKGEPSADASGLALYRFAT
jgi:glycine oxidase